MPFDDVDMVGSWVYGLTLVDADGKPLRASLGYGEGNWGVGSGVADYVFSHEDAYPEQVYLAPQTGEESYGNASRPIVRPSDLCSLDMSDPCAFDKAHMAAFVDGTRNADELITQIDRNITAGR